MPRALSHTRTALKTIFFSPPILLVNHSSPLPTPPPSPVQQAPNRPDTRPRRRRSARRQYGTSLRCGSTASTPAVQAAGAAPWAARGASKQRTGSSRHDGAPSARWELLSAAPVDGTASSTTPHRAACGIPKHGGPLPGGACPKPPRAATADGAAMSTTTTTPCLSPCPTTRPCPCCSGPSSRPPAAAASTPPLPPSTSGAPTTPPAAAPCALPTPLTPGVVASAQNLRSSAPPLPTPPLPAPTPHIGPVPAVPSLAAGSAAAAAAPAAGTALLQFASASRATPARTLAGAGAAPIPAATALSPPCPAPAPAPAGAAPAPAAAAPAPAPAPGLAVPWADGSVSSRLSRTKRRGAASRPIPSAPASGTHTTCTSLRPPVPLPPPAPPPPQSCCPRAMTLWSSPGPLHLSSVRCVSAGRAASSCRTVRGVTGCTRRRVRARRADSEGAASSSERHTSQGLWAASTVRCFGGGGQGGRKQEVQVGMVGRECVPSVLGLCESALHLPSYSVTVCMFPHKDAAGACSQPSRLTGRGDDCHHPNSSEGRGDAPAASLQETGRLLRFKR